MKTAELIERYRAKVDAARAAQGHLFDAAKLFPSEANEEALRVQSRMTEQLERRLWALEDENVGHELSVQQELGLAYSWSDPR